MTLGAVTFLFAALSASAPQVGPAPLTPGDVQRLAILAVEGDSVPAVRARWSSWRETLPEPLLADLGIAYLDLFTYRYEEADRALDGLVRTLPTDHPLRPYVLLASGEGWLQRGRYPRSADALREASETPGADPAMRALTLIRLAGVSGRVEGVLPPLALLQEASGLVPPDDPFLMSRFLCARAGRFGGRTAREDAEDGASLALEAGVKRHHAACRMLVAQEYHQAGDVDMALTVYDLIQQEQAQARDRATRAATLQWMGYVLLTTGNYDMARQRLLEAVFEGESSGGWSAVAWAHLNLAAISNSMGDLATALEHADRAAALFEEQGDRWGMGALRGTRAQTAKALGLWDEAVRDIDAARESARSGGDRAALVGSQLSLVDVALARGDLDTAESELQEAYRLVERFNMPGWRYGVRAAEAEVALRKRELPRARQALEEYLRPIQSPVRRYRAVARLAEVLVAEGHVAEAADSLDAALSALEYWRTRQDPAVLRRYAFQIQEFREDPDLGIATVIAAIARDGDPERAFTIATRQKARMLLERLLRARAVRGGARTTALDPLQTVSPSLPADSVAARLPDGTALLHFTTGIGGEPTTLFLLQTSGLRSFALPPGDSLAPAIARFVANVGDTTMVDRLGSRLSQQILGPALGELDAGTHTLVVVPDGPLHRLPFGVLRLPDGAWVGERFAVAVAPSAAVFLALAEAPPPTDQRILAFGDPAIPAAGWGIAGSEGLRGTLKALQPLPGAAFEARRVARFSKDGRALLGSGATEAALRASYRGYGILHFATHAFVGGASDDRIALVLAPGGGSDGLLGPGDLASLDLSATSLVFLSACETTRGQVLRGEGVEGLTAPLLAAGVRTVVATAWKVDDRIAAEVAEGFYRRLAEGLTAGESLRAAKRMAAQKGVPAAQWGAFVLLGDPQLRVDLREPMPARRLIQGGLLVALLALALALRPARRLRPRRDF